MMPKDPIKREETLRKMRLAHSNISEETRQRMSQSQRGRVATEETRRKQSEVRRGKKMPPRSEQWREKQRVCHLGIRHPQTEETKQKLRELRLGEKNPFYGKRHTPEVRQYMGDYQRGDKNHNYGIPMPIEVRLKLRQYTGEKTSNWKGGVSSLKQLFRAESKFWEWRSSVIERDEGRDAFTGKQILGEIEVHHIIPLNVLLRKYKIKTISELNRCNEIWDINNGMTLSKKNHRAYHRKWGNL